MSRMLVTVALLILSIEIVDAAYVQLTPSPTVSPQARIAQQQEKIQKQIKRMFEKPRSPYVGAWHSDNNP
jgi:hypothetical protein